MVDNYYGQIPLLANSASPTITAQTPHALRRRGAACEHDYGKFHASSVTLTVHSRVVGLRLEGS